MILTFDQAREIVVREVGLSAGAQPILLGESEGRVLAEEILADRDYPPFRRSALRSVSMAAC